MMKISSHSPLFRYGLAIAISLVTCVGMLVLRSALDTAFFVLLLLAGLISAWYGGPGPGLLAIAITTLFCVVAIVLPTRSLTTSGMGEWFTLGLVVAVAVLAVLLLTSRSQQRRDNKRAILINEVNSVVNTGLDHQTTINNLARLSLTTLADYCLIYSLDRATGDIKLDTIAHIDSVLEQKVRDMHELVRPSIRQNKGLNALVYQTRQSILVKEATKNVPPSLASQAEVRRFINDIQLVSYIVVPLIARDEFIGSMTLGVVKPSRPYDEADLKLAEDFARYAALVVDNANLYQEKEREAQRQEEALAQLNAVLANSPVGICFVDSDLRYVTINQALADINGRTIEEHLGRTVPEVLPELAEGVTDIFEQVIKTGQPVVNTEIQGRPPSTPNKERYFLASYYPIQLSRNAPPGVGVVLIEITQQKQAAANQEFLGEASVILNNSLNYQQILTSIAELSVPYLADVCTVDLIKENNEVERIAVTHADPAKAKLIQLLNRRYAPNPEAIRASFATVWEGKSILVREVKPEAAEAYARDDEHLAILRELGPYYSLMVVPLIVRGQLIGVINFSTTELSKRRYNTDNLALAEELARRAALAADNARLYQDLQEAANAETELSNFKDLFISTASHELRSPLASVKGFAQMTQRNLHKLQASATSPETERILSKAISSLDTVVQQSNRMNNLISQLMDFSRVQSGQMTLNYNEKVNLSALVTRVVEQQQAVAERHKIICQAEENVFLPCDESRIEQVLTNLITNSVKYSEVGKNITVTLTRQPTEAGKFEAVVAVTDQGRGISPTDQEHIFERFYRVKDSDVKRIDGLGLGLAISYDIIEQHHGRMWVTSIVGDGSTFYFALPFEPPADVANDMNSDEAGMI